MAKIQVEINGQLHDVKRVQLFDLAKRGVITPDTKVIYNGRELAADMVKGLEFNDQEESIALEILNQSVPQTPVEVPLVKEHERLDKKEQPKWEYEPFHFETENKDEIDKMFLTLSLASLIPGLGHYLLGCGKWRCAWLTYNAAMKLILLVIGLSVFIAMLMGLTSLIHEALLESGNDILMYGGMAFTIVCGLFLTLFLIPFLFIFIYWIVYHDLIENLKKEYDKRFRRFDTTPQSQRAGHRL